MKNIHFIHFDTIDSTNTWAKVHASQLAAHSFTCITALEQTAGRGRFQRKWHSPRGQNLYATLFFQVPANCPYFPNIGQILAYSCAQMLREKGFPAQIKWPNDILVHEKKIGGVLMETVSQEGLTAIILGIGLNINMEPAALQAIDQPATSLLDLSGKVWNIPQVLEALLSQFLTHFEVLKNEGFSAFRQPFEELLFHRGQEIICRDGIRTLKGICHALAPDGRLQLLLPSGELQAVAAGELMLGN